MQCTSNTEVIDSISLWLSLNSLYPDWKSFYSFHLKNLNHKQYTTNITGLEYLSTYEHCGLAAPAVTLRVLKVELLASHLVASTLWINKHKKGLALSWSRRFDLKYMTIKSNMDKNVLQTKDTVKITFNKLNNDKYQAILTTKGFFS